MELSILSVERFLNNMLFLRCFWILMESDLDSIVRSYALGITKVPAPRAQKIVGSTVELDRGALV